MQTLDEKPETIHLYVVREEQPKPSVLPIILSMFALSILVSICILSPSRQPEERLTLRLPAVFLPLQTFTASVQIIPTGIKVYPATNAHGILTITNGSIISQTIPQGFTIDGVVTEASVFVPAGSANGYGYARVSAHALTSGKIGNIPPLSVNVVEGSSVYIRNLSPFTGGKNAYSVKVVTPQDTQTATESARISLTSQIARIKAFLEYPCKESSQIKNNVAGLSWACQYVSYSVPSYMKVTHVRLVKKTLLVDVVFVPKPHIIVFK